MNNSNSAMEPSEAIESDARRSLQGRLIVVDDEIELLTVICDRLRKHGFEVTGFSSPTEALAAIESQDFDLLLTDMMMPEMSGLDLLRTAQEINPQLVCILMTGQATIESAVSALKLGALDFIVKPFKIRMLLPVLTRALDTRRLRQENLELRETVGVHELCRAISYSFDTSTLLEKIVDAAVQQCDADEASIMLPTLDGSELYVAAVRGPDRADLLGLHTPITTGIAGLVAEQHEPLVIQGESTDALLRAHFKRPDITASASLPLLARGQLVGILNVNSTRRRYFSIGQVKALNVLASAGAAAIEATTLFSKVKQAEQQYRSIFENAAEGIFRMRPNGQLELANPALASMLGYPSPADLKQEVSNFIEQLFIDPSIWRQKCDGLPEDSTALLECQLIRRDKTICWASMTVRRISGNGTQYFEGIVEDVTERKRAETAMLEMTRKLQALIEAAPLAIFTLNREQKIDIWNPAAERIFGCSAEELSRQLDATIPPEKMEEHTELMSRLEQGESVVGLETQRKRLNGDTLEVNLFASPLSSDDGTTKEFVFILEDTTERKSLEAQLRHAQRMESLGRLAGGVAHDFNNLLTVINGFSDLALGSLDDSDPNKELIENVNKAGQKASQLTRQLLAFSKKQIVSPASLNLRAIVDDMVRLLNRVLGSHVKVAIQSDPDLWTVYADAGQIEQIVMNMAINARDAMPEGGRLDIRMSNVVLDEAYVAANPEAVVGDHVLLELADTGIGMDCHTLTHIFEPFFTTKGPERGTGLGLATTYGIVRQAGGHITVTSELNVGTTFRVYFPRQVAGDGVAHTEQRRLKEASGSETILLVEDNDEVRAVASRILAKAGYKVLEAHDAEAALAIARQPDFDAHILITDLVMPKMSGFQFINEFKKFHPDLPILCISGYIDDSILQHDLQQQSLAILQKPFDPASLTTAVRQVLSNNPVRLL